MAMKNSKNAIYRIKFMLNTEYERWFDYKIPIFDDAEIEEYGCDDIVTIDFDNREDAKNVLISALNSVVETITANNPNLKDAFYNFKTKKIKQFIELIEKYPDYSLEYHSSEDDSFSFLFSLEKLVPREVFGGTIYETQNLKYAHYSWQYDCLTLI